MFISNEFFTNKTTQLKFVHLQKAFNRRDQLPLRSKTIWKIDQGIVRTFTCNNEGKIITLGFWDKGDIVGRPLSQLEIYQIECLTQVQATEIPPDFSCLHEALRTNIWKGERLLSINNQYKVINRLWNLLDWLASRFGQAIPNGILLNLYLTHQDIAETINTSRVRVTKLLNQLERNGKIERSGRDLILRIK